MSARCVAVLGGGTMGNGIAQVAAMAGYEVRLRDVEDRLLEQARHRIETSLGRFVKSGKLARQGVGEVFDRMRFTTDVAEAVNGAGVVVEAVPELLEVKQEVFLAVVRAAPKDCLLATNTSQLSISQIGAALGEHSERLVGTHFFNPPVLMKLVEIIRGIVTSDDAVDRAIEFSRSIGKEVVVCRKDSPGFITTRAYAAMRLECLRMLEEGVASAEDIDTAMRLGFNFPMGPFELGDFNGLDISWHVLRSLTDAYGERFRPTVGLRNMIAAGHLGRKTGQGFYRYDAEGRRVAE